MSRKNFKALKTILKGVNTKLDRQLAVVENAWKKLELIEDSKIIDLAIEDLPTTTETQKKRKKILLLFLKAWRDLESEIERIRTELNHQAQANNSADKLKSTSRLIAFAKGPLGLITGLAGLIVVGTLFLQANAVEVAIINRGCDAIVPTSYSSYSLPGLRLPQQTIANGQSGAAILPPLSFDVVLTGNQAQASALNLKLTFTLPDKNTLIYFDDQLLNNKQTRLDLGSQKSHQLVIECQ